MDHKLSYITNMELVGRGCPQPAAVFGGRRSGEKRGLPIQRSREFLLGIRHLDVHRERMGAGKPDRISRLIAEELLATIFGEDLVGCTVSLDEVANIIHTAIEERVQQDTKLLEIYDTVVSSIHQLATPPAFAKSAGPDELRSLLGERLDAIRAITIKTLETSARIKAERSGSGDAST